MESQPTRDDPRYLAPRIRQALADDARVSMLDIKVFVKERVIHITGQVDTEDRREAMRDVVAQAAPGFEVRDETTELELAPPGHPEVIVD
jgi:osmotically-inducible protein OsmY